MKLALPDVTLVMIETREHDLANLAVRECTDAAEFGGILICTDKPAAFDATLFHWSCPARFVEVPDWPMKEGWSRFLWNDAARYVATSHMLVIQWDSWITSPEKWRNEFLNYDYIGAPWWYKNGLNVGNGGFSLRSTALMRFVADKRATFPCVNAWDDDQLCRKYRPTLQERHGFLWAPEKVAFDFAWECVMPPEPSFGFHGIFNWPLALEGEKLEERVKLAAASRYIRGAMWKELVKAYPAAAKFENELTAHDG